MPANPPAADAHPAAADTREDPPGVDRLLALSDGVVAIALTLLVLQLRVPSAAQVTDPTSAAELAAQLSRGGDRLVSYVISYYVIAQFWLVHHRVFRHVAGQREGLAWWNFAFLPTITLMPFTSDLLGSGSTSCSPAWPPRPPWSSAAARACWPAGPAPSTPGPREPAPGQASWSSPCPSASRG
jgi:hypothetical protein